MVWASSSQAMRFQPFDVLKSERVCYSEGFDQSTSRHLINGTDPFRYGRSPSVPSPFTPGPCFPSLGCAERMTQMLLEETVSVPLVVSSSPALPAWGLKLVFQSLFPPTSFQKEKSEARKRRERAEGVLNKRGRESKYKAFVEYKEKTFFITIS